MFRLTSLASTNIRTISSSPCKVIGGVLKNTSAATKFVKFYNKATDPVLATDVPVFIFALSANESLPLFSVFGTYGQSFDLGLAMAITGSYPPTDATAVAVNDVNMNLVFAK